MVAHERSVPQRLKPLCEAASYGTAEAVPLSKTIGAGIDEGEGTPFDKLCEECGVMA